MDIGESLKIIRKTRNINQEKLSIETGISQSALSLWERNKRTPNIIDCIKLADYYEITLDELVGRDNF